MILYIIVLVLVFVWYYIVLVLILVLVLPVDQRRGDAAQDGDGEPQACNAINNNNNNVYNNTISIYNALTFQ